MTNLMLRHLAFYLLLAGLNHPRLLNARSKSMTALICKPMASCRPLTNHKSPSLLDARQIGYLSMIAQI